MNKLEKSIQKNAFNEDDMLIQIQARTYPMKSRLTYGGTNMKKVAGILALSFTLIFAVWFGFNQNNVVQGDTVVMLVGIDINPSFELSVNQNDNVVKIDALNVDAQTIEVSDLIDQPVDLVVEEIIRRSAEAGFIDVNDLEEDYVVVSTVSMNDDEDNQDKLEEKIQLRVRDSEFLQSLNIVQVKATQREKFEADGKNIPVGLYVINGFVEQEDGTFLSAKEFFSNPENKENLDDRTNINLENQEKLRTRIETALGQLESNGMDATEYRLRLENATYEQMLQIQAELKVETKNQNKNVGSDDSNKPDDSDNSTNQGESNKPDDNGNGSSKDNQNSGSGKGN
jgi:hypothetical protein